MNYRRTSDGTWVQLGIASFRYAAYSVPDPYCSSDAPFVFTRVSSYLQWIYTTTGLLDPDNPLSNKETITPTPTETTVSKPTNTPFVTDNSSTFSNTVTSTKSPTTAEPNRGATLKTNLFFINLLFGTKGIALPLAVTAAFTLAVSTFLKP